MYQGRGRLVTKEGKVLKGIFESGTFKEASSWFFEVYFEFEWKSKYESLNKTMRVNKKKIGKNKCKNTSFFRQIILQYKHYEF